MLILQKNVFSSFNRMTTIFMVIFFFTNLYRYYLLKLFSKYFRNKKRYSVLFHIIDIFQKLKSPRTNERELIE